MSDPSNEVFFAISDPTRRSILNMLTQGNLALKDISGQLPITRTAVSKHLKVLHEADLVKCSKEGRETVYELSPEPLLIVREWLDYYSNFWDDKLKSLKDFVES
jgi:DNA-binding transcriptional ArsR family regulator